MTKMLSIVVGVSTERLSGAVIGGLLWLGKWLFQPRQKRRQLQVQGSLHFSLTSELRGGDLFMVLLLMLWLLPLLF